MAAGPSLGCWYGRPMPRPKSFAGRLTDLETTANNMMKAIMSYIEEWTPCLLVTSYFVFSVSMYTFCTQSLITMFWFIYLTTNFYIAGSTVMEAFMSLTPCRDARKAVCKVTKNGWVFPTPDEELLVLDLLIVAYLPNEKDIIMDRVHYALNEIAYPSNKIRINLVYNTPYAIEPLETALQELETRKSHFRLIKVPGSTSKADNLNYFFSLKTDSDVITIFDADHYTHPYGPRWAVERFIQDQKVDIVQGRCVIFNAKASWLSSMISVEFDKIYAVSHPGRAAMWGFGLFTGSNGYWRTKLLQDLKMDGTVLTEDIDSTLRAITRGCKIVHELNVVSYELAPTTIPAMWKQRLRWAQGWTQVSLKHTILAFNKPTGVGKRSFKERFGLFSLLAIRESSYYLVTQYLCLVLSFIVTEFPKSPAALATMLFFPFPVSQWFFIVSIMCLLATLIITNRVKSEFVSYRAMVMFCVIYTPYLVFMATMGLYGHARQVTRYSKWNATKRT